MKLISIKKAKEIWEANDGDPGEALWVLSGEYGTDEDEPEEFGEPLFTTIDPVDGFPEDETLFFVPIYPKDIWVHDFDNCRVVTEDDEPVFYTEELTCDIEIISHVVLLHNQNDHNSQEIGSGGIIDEYLLNAICTQDDRKHIVESIYLYQNK
jgi:hypothetical protein